MLDDATCIIGGCTDSTSIGYMPSATYNDGSCPVIYLGCTDSTATNYRDIANSDDNSCLYAGCLQSGMVNYDPNADLPGECTPYTDGCMAAGAQNLVPWANRDDGTCKFVGCTDSERDNYDPTATADDGTCTPVFYGCSDPQGENYKIDYTRDDGSCSFGGCTNSAFEAYDLKATFNDLTCNAGSTRRALSDTCLDPAASNYNQEAACEYRILGCTNEYAINYLDVAEQDKGDPGGAVKAWSPPAGRSPAHGRWQRSAVSGRSFANGREDGRGTGFG